MNHRFWIEADGKGQWVDGQWLQGKLWLHMNGETFVAESEAKVFGQGRGAKTKSDIVAPMPGKVTKVLAHDGSMISVGQVLVVMEAMKMEYSLKAEQAGIVKRVDCKVGDQVALGKVLVKIDADPADADKGDT